MGSAPGDRLGEQRCDGGDAIALGPVRDRRREVVELGGPDDGPRHPTSLHEALLLALAGIVGVASDPVDADDR